MKRNRYFIVVLMLGICFWWSVSAWADRIIMKDGSVVESDKIWETEKYIHFILKGTQSVEIRFLKKIVERVESQSISFPAQAPDPVHVQSEPEQTSSSVAADRTAAVETAESAMATSLNSTGRNGQRFPLTNVMPLAPLESLKDIQFYDPRRPQKYWVTPKERYDTLNAALKALAVQYNTTVQWVQNHMGNTNALSEIHKNLRKSLQP
jgi:hypothetical protein